MYLSASDIEKMEGVHKTHYLNPAARRLNKSRHKNESLLTPIGPEQPVAGEQAEQ